MRYDLQNPLQGHWTYGKKIQRNSCGRRAADPPSEYLAAPDPALPANELPLVLSRQLTAFFPTPHSIITLGNLRHSGPDPESRA